MKQPFGFENQFKLQAVHRLIKSMYGLKKAQRAWFEKLHDVLLAEGFHFSQSDHSLFILDNPH